MRVRNMMAIGVFSTIGMIGMANAPGSAAADSNQSGLIEVRVGQGGSMYYKGGQVSGCTVSAAEQNKGELVEVRVGQGGSIYHRAGQVSGCTVSAEGQHSGTLVEERVGHGGSIYYR